jgi:hypothetical protein
MRKKVKKVFGIGVNDSPEPVHKREIVNGKSKITWVCPYYVAWKHIMERCYDPKFYLKNPTYKGCTMCDGWLSFMTFKSWMEAQDWQDKHPDKDILQNGGKHYSPETVRFIDRRLNMFLTDSGAARGEWPIGVSWHKRFNKFQAACNNPFTKKKEHLGAYTCPNEAHEAWRKRKHELACQWADLQDDPLIAKALRERFLKKD